MKIKLGTLRLVDDWHKILFRAWSVRFSLFAAACGGLVMCWPALQDRLNIWWFCVGGVVLSVGAVVFRLLDQGFAKPQIKRVGRRPFSFGKNEEDEEDD